MRIMFDIDGVPADLMGGFTKLAKVMSPAGEVQVVAGHNYSSWNSYGGLTNAQIISVWGGRPSPAVRSGMN